MPIPLTPDLHEFYANRGADGVASCGLGLAVAGTGPGEGDLLWVRQAMLDREDGVPFAPGLEAHGLITSRVLLVRAREEQAALQAALEGSRCTALRAVLIELWGEARAYDLTASRRLALAAKASGVPVLMTRVAGTPSPSAAETRWRVRSIASRALAAKAPGNPAFEMTLLRARNGQEGQCYQVEWDRDARKLVSRSLVPRSPGSAGNSFARPAPLSGAVASLSFDGPDTAPAYQRRQAG